jgi:hypothetical protein
MSKSSFPIRKYSYSKQNSRLSCEYKNYYEYKSVYKIVATLNAFKDV